MKNLNVITQKHIKKEDFMQAQALALTFAILATVLMAFLIGYEKKSTGQVKVKSFIIYGIIAVCMFIGAM